MLRTEDRGKGCHSSLTMTAGPCFSIDDITATTSEFRTLHLVYATTTPIDFQHPDNSEFLVSFPTSHLNAVGPQLK